MSAVLVGAGVALAAWLVFVPWDLSEIDPTGTPIPGGGDANAGRIALVPVVILAVALPLAWSGPSRHRAAILAFGGCATWVLLFGWRAGTSAVVGANFFVLPLVFAVIPTALVLPLIVAAVSRRHHRSGDSPPPPRQS